MDMEKNNVSRNELNCDTSCAAVTNGNDGPDGTVQTVPLAPESFQPHDTQDSHSPSDDRDVKIMTPYIKISAAAAILAVVVLTASLLSVDFAEWYARTVGQWIRAILGIISGWIPFSLAECLLLCILPLAAAYIIKAWKAIGASDSRRVFLAQLLPAVALLFNLVSVYFLGFGTSNYRLPLEQNVGLERNDVSAEELYDTSLIISSELALLEPELERTPSGDAVMPYSFYRLSILMNEAYADYCADNDYISTFPALGKPVAMSEPMTYTHISGVYSYFTGEANVNINYPDYILPYTLAHEMAHQRGIAREDEANFVAFLVCMESEDPYIRYSALLNMQEYVMSALGRASSKLYSSAYYAMNGGVRAELAAYGEFFDKYRESVAADVADSVNNAFLQAQGQTEGTRSYGTVVDLAVAYYKRGAN